MTKYSQWDTQHQAWREVMGPVIRLVQGDGTETQLWDYPLDPPVMAALMDAEDLLVEDGVLDADIAVMLTNVKDQAAIARDTAGEIWAQLMAVTQIVEARETERRISSGEGCS